jgi:putative transposase
VKYAFMRAHHDRFKVLRMCRALEVSRSGYYGWCNRKESQRSEKNRAVLVEIQKVHEENREAYGAVKTWRELKAQGIECGRHRVARLRRQAGIETRRKRRFRITTRSRAGMIAAENKLNRCFEVGAVDRAWVGDITFIATGSGWLYLAVLLDLYSRRVVGWAMSERIDQRLVLDALTMGLGQGRAQAGLIHHTDQGRQYSSTAYVEMLKKHGLVQSMSRRGNCYDNAVAESFFSSLKNELVHHCSFKTREHARTAVFEYIEVFYNRQRRHQSLDYVSPVDYERSMAVA